MEPLANTKLVTNSPGATATITGPIEQNPYSSPLTLVCVAGNRGAGTGTWTPKLQLVLPDPLLINAKTGTDPAAAYNVAGGAAPTFVDLWIAAAAISGNGTTVYQLNPSGTPTPTQLTEGKLLCLPPYYRWVFTYGGAGAFDLTAYESLHSD